MNYETIILELMARVQKLESEVSQLKEEKLIDKDANIQTKEHGSYTEMAKAYILEQIDNARKNGEISVVLRAGDIQTAIGIKNRPVIICNAMKQVMQPGDKILEAPPSGYSTTVKVEYFIHKGE